MNIVFIVGIIEALYFSFILLLKKKKSRADKVIAGWLVIISLNLLIPIFTYSDFSRYFRLNGLDYGLLILHPIFLYIYTKLLITEKEKPRINYIIPIAVLVIHWIFIIQYIYLPKETKLSFVFDSEFPLIVWIGTILVNIVYVVYLFLTSRIIFSYQRNIKDQYSFTEQVNLNWLKYLTVGMIVVYFLGGVVGAILCYMGVPLYYINYFVYSSLVLFVFGLGFFGIKQKSVFTSDLNEDADFTKKQTIITEQDKIFGKKLETYMIEEQPYLNEKLSLFELAELLNVKPYYITFILNRVLKNSFYDFVNHYRVEEIKKRIEEGEISKFTILSVAFDCGFNSKASFNRIFKAFTGYSPTDYIRSFSGHSKS